MCRYAVDSQEVAGGLILLYIFSSTQSQLIESMKCHSLKMKSKPKDFSFSVINDKEKQRILKLKKVERVNF